MLPYLPPHFRDIIYLEEMPDKLVQTGGRGKGEMIEREESREPKGQEGEKREEIEIEYVNLNKFYQLFSSISLILRIQIDAELEYEEGEGREEEEEGDERKSERIKNKSEGEKQAFCRHILVDRNEEILFSLSHALKPMETEDVRIDRENFGFYLSNHSQIEQLSPTPSHVLCDYCGLALSEVIEKNENLIFLNLIASTQSLFFSSLKGSDTCMPCVLCTKHFCLKCIREEKNLCIDTFHHITSSPSHPPTSPLSPSQISSPNLLPSSVFQSTYVVESAQMFESSVCEYWGEIQR